MSGGPVTSFYKTLFYYICSPHTHESENRKTCAMSLICDSKKITAIVLIYVLLFIMQLHSFFYSDLFVMFIFFENYLILTR